MRVPRFRPLRAGSFVAAIAVLGAGLLPAQQGAVIAGRVTSDRGDALGGASVIVANTNLSAVTAADGTYRLTVPADAIRGPQITLSARYIGHRPGIQRVSVTPGTMTVNFELAGDPLRLDEVVVTGTAEAMESKKLSFAVAKVSDEQLREVPGVSALGAI